MELNDILNELIEALPTSSFEKEGATKDEIKAEIVENNYSFFTGRSWLFEELIYSLPNNQTENFIFSDNDLGYNEGNDNYLCEVYKLTDKNNVEYYILLEGVYSSWGDSELETICLAEPYEYTEIRYREFK